MRNALNEYNTQNSPTTTQQSTTQQPSAQQATQQTTAQHTTTTEPTGGAKSHSLSVGSSDKAGKKRTNTVKITPRPTTDVVDARGTPQATAKRAKIRAASNANISTKTAKSRALVTDKLVEEREYNRRQAAGQNSTASAQQATQQSTTEPTNGAKSQSSSVGTSTKKKNKTQTGTNTIRTGMGKAKTNRRPQILERDFQELKKMADDGLLQSTRHATAQQLATQKAIEKKEHKRKLRAGLISNV